MIRRDETGQTVSLWAETVSLPRFPPLGENAEADVCVVGAGIAGLMTAYLLCREGRLVVVIDDGPIAGGQTQRTTAHLSNAIDRRYMNIERLHGEEGARLTAQSHSQAIDLLEAIARDERIDCDFERLDGYLFLAPDHSADLLEEELAAAKRAGLSDVARVERFASGGFDPGPCLRFPRQAQFHMLKFAEGLVRAIQRDGGRLFTHTHAAKIEDGTPARVEVDGGYTIVARDVVVATHTPVNDRVAIHAKQAAYITYVIGALVPRSSMTRALYWDTHDPYHYVRLHSPPGDAPHDVLIAGGEDHKTGQTRSPEAHFERLERWARERFSAIQEVPFRWSGQVMESIDGLAYMGRNPNDDHVYVITGDCGMGMTHGTLGVRLVTDEIVGRENSWAALYDPSRKTLRAAGTFASENLNVLEQYVRWITPGDVGSADAILPHQGAVIRRGASKLAVYRDPRGELHTLSAVCPHLGCIVEWNSAEKTWDCPCHGSRFDRFGKVLEGPANVGLSEAPAPAEIGKK